MNTERENMLELTRGRNVRIISATPDHESEEIEILIELESNAGLMEPSNAMIFSLHLSAHEVIERGACFSRNSANDC